MTTSETTTRRVRVTLEPLPGVRPWRAVIVESPDSTRLGSVTSAEVPVGRFDDQLEAITTACSALRFVNAGISWQPVGDQ
jgi:hypothetical protein